MSLYEEVLDELEAGELSVEFEGQEPQALLEWALDRFSPRIAISTAFQIDGSVLIDMAYAIDPGVKVFTVDTGRLPGETFELMEQVRDRYPGIELEILSPDAQHVSRMVGKHGPNLFYRQVEHRLLCCQVRKVLPLTRHLHSLDAWITGLRRDQWASRTDIRKIEIDHDHGADRQAQPARRVDRGRGLGLRARERRPHAPAVRARLHVDRLRALHARDRTRRGGPRRALVVGDERAQGVRHPLRDRDRRARARAARPDRRAR